MTAQIHILIDLQHCDHIFSASHYYTEWISDTLYEVYIIVRIVTYNFGKLEGMPIGQIIFFSMKHFKHFIPLFSLGQNLKHEKTKK